MANVQTLTFAPSSKKVANGRWHNVGYDVAAHVAPPGTNADGTEQPGIPFAAMIVNGYTLPPASLSYLLVYGLKQSLADSFASAKDQPEFEAMLGKRLDKIIAGTMSVRDATGRLDAFESECIRMAKDRLAQQAAAKKRVLPKADSAEYKNMLRAVRNGKAKEAIESTARSIIAAREAVNIDSDDIDFDGIDAGAEPDATEPEVAGEDEPEAEVPEAEVPVAETGKKGKK